MGGEYLLLFLEDIRYFLLEGKILLLILVFHSFLHRIHIILHFLLLDVLLHFLGCVLLLDIDLLGYLVVGLLFRILSASGVGVACRSVQSFLYWSGSYHLLLFLLLFQLLLFWLLFLSVSYGDIVFGWNFVLWDQHCFLVIVVLGWSLNWSLRLFGLYGLFFLDVLGWVYLVNLLLLHLKGLIFSVLLDHFVVHFVQLWVVFQPVCIS